MQEYHAHEVLTDYLESKEFVVTRHAYGMETAFTAEYSKGTTGRRIGFCAEYDALPGYVYNRCHEGKREAHVI